MEIVVANRPGVADVMRRVAWIVQVFLDLTISLDSRLHDRPANWAARNRRFFSGSTIWMSSVVNVIAHQLHRTRINRLISKFLIHSNQILTDSCTCITL